MTMPATLYLWTCHSAGGQDGESGADGPALHLSTSPSIDIARIFASQDDYDYPSTDEDRGSWQITKIYGACLPTAITDANIICRLISDRDYKDLTTYTNFADYCNMQCIDGIDNIA